MNRHPRLSLDLLRAFRAAAAYLSFTRAARDQFVTQSAISHAIRTLEEQLGQPLFHRVNRSLRLTHAGEALYRATDVRIVATNDRIDVDREHLDLAIHFVPPWENAPDADPLVEYRQFPVCSPVLARSRKNPLRTPADPTGPVESFVAWLREEVRRDADAAPAVLDLSKAPARSARRGRTEATRRARPSA